MALIKHISRPSRDFDMIPHSISQGLGFLSDSAFRVFVFLFSQGPTYKPSYGGLARAIYSRGHPKGESNIRRAVEELKVAGLIEIRQRGFNRYDWVLMDGTSKRTDEGAE